MFTLKECREKKNVSVEKISSVLGVTTQKYASFEEYEAGMSIKEGVNFSIFTGVPINQIYFFKP